MKYRGAIIKATDAFMRLPKSGRFIVSCIDHSLSLFDETWTGLVVSGKSIQQAFGDWFYERGSRPKYNFVDCPYPCNPTCPWSITYSFFANQRRVFNWLRVEHFEIAFIFWNLLKYMSFKISFYECIVGATYGFTFQRGQWKFADLLATIQFVAFKLSNAIDLCARDRDKELFL